MLRDKENDKSVPHNHRNSLFTMQKFRKINLDHAKAFHVKNAIQL